MVSAKAHSQTLVYDYEVPECPAGEKVVVDVDVDVSVEYPKSPLSQTTALLPSQDGSSNFPEA
eukprot:2534866-Amphidinium_carterae.1